MRRFGIVFASVFAIAGTGACAEKDIDPAAAKAIALTRETRATYSVFAWNVITPPGSASMEEWSAEFNAGTLHRVETPHARLIADCSEGTGAFLNLLTGEVTHGAQVARAACGIDANSQILEAKVSGAARGKYGATQLLRIRDPEEIRTYEIASNGAIVGATISNSSGKLLLTERVVAMENTAPQDIFSEDSLRLSAVPERYKSRPPE